jgi:hypothetical protein
VAAIIVAIIGASLRPLGEGPSWTAAFAQYYLVAAVTSYGISFTVGALTFFTLRKLRRESLKAYGNTGFVVGLVYGVYVTFPNWFSPERIAAQIFFALLGCSVAVAFAALRGTCRNKAKEAMG